MLTLILGLGNIGKKYDKTRHNLGFEVVDRVVDKLGAVRQEDGECYQWWKGEVEVVEERSRRPEAGLAMTGSETEDEERLLRRDVLRQAQDDVASRNDDLGDARDTRNDDSADGDVRLAQDQGGRQAGAHDGTNEDGSHSKLWGTEDRQGRSPDVTTRRVILAKPTTYMNGSGEAARQLIGLLGITPAEILVIVDDFQIPLGAVRFRPNGSDGGHNGLVSVIEELGTQAFPRLRLGIGAPADKGQVVDYVLSRFTADEQSAVEKMLAIAAEGVIFAVQHRLEKVMSKYNFNPAPPDLA